jgi:predicted transposase YbfD/YdcC
MLSTIEEHFAEITDERQQYKVRYPLQDILLITLVGVICGADGWEAIEEVGKNKLKLLKKYGYFHYGIPVHDTIARIISAIEPSQFQACFINWMKAAEISTQGEIIAVDGKTVRGSYDKKGKQSAIHMVSAFAAENGVVLGQIKTHEKSNEITAIPDLLSKLNIKGAVVTIDAMGCQKAIAKKIIQKEADYVLAVKGNQGHLSTAIKDFFDIAHEENFNQLSHHFTEEIDKAHGRIERRRYWLTEDLSSLKDLTAKWFGLKSVGMVESERHIGDKVTIDRRYFICSLKETDELFAKAVRRHWSVENELHWVLDVSFREDNSRIRRENGAENMATARHITLNMLRQEKTCKKGIKAKRFKAALDSDYAEKVLSTVF